MENFSLQEATKENEQTRVTQLQNDEKKP